MLLCAGVKPARRGKDVRLRISCDQAEGGRLIVTINFFGTVVIPFTYYYFLAGAASRPARRLPGGGLQVRLPLHLAPCSPWHLAPCLPWHLAPCLPWHLAPCLPWHLALYSAWYIHCTPPCTWKGHCLINGIMPLILPKLLQRLVLCLDLCSALGSAFGTAIELAIVAAPGTWRRTCHCTGTALALALAYMRLASM